MTKEKPSQKELLSALIEGKSQAYHELYRTTYKQVEYHIISNNGEQADAKDIFQDSIIALMRMIKKPRFELKANLSTVLFSISRNLWLKYIRDKMGKEVNIIDDDNRPFIVIAEDELEEKKEAERKHVLISDKLEEMSDICKQVIQYFYFKKLKHDRIAEIMGYTKAYVRIRLFRCMEKLRKEVAN